MDRRVSLLMLAGLWLGVVLATGPAQAQRLNPPAFVPEPEESAQSDLSARSPGFLLLDGPIDWESLRQRLRQPDMVILRQKEYEALVEQSRERPSVVESTAIVTSLDIRGEAGTDNASLRLMMAIEMIDEPASWVSIRLDGLVPTDARQGTRALPIRLEPGGTAWQVELSGAGVHRVAVTVVAPVRETADGRRLELAIPAAAGTRLELEVAGRLSGAWTGDREPVSVAPSGIDGVSRVEGHLPPRDLLVLLWKGQEAGSGPGEPVLTVQGEIALDVDRGTLLARSTWLVRCDRGQPRVLEFLIEDPGEELVSLELDGLPLAVEGLRNASSGKVTVPLASPLQPAASNATKLTMTTRRPIPSGTTTRLAYTGYRFLNAPAQAGVMAIVQGSDLWVSGRAGRGLRQIDPVADLPESLRPRPRTVLAFQFVEQPFEFELRVDPSPPTTRTELRTQLVVEPDEIQNTTWLDVQATRGRVFELRVEIPPGLELVDVGPASHVAASQELQQPAGEPGQERRMVQIRLTPQVVEEANFTIRLTGRQPIVLGRPIQALSFLPRNTTVLGGRIGLRAGRSIAIDSSALITARIDGSPFAPIDPIASPEWPVVNPPGTPVAWLRFDGWPEPLDFLASQRERELTHETRLLATVGRRQIDLSQITTCHVRNGAIDSIEVLVPRELEAQPGRWGVTGAEVSGRTETGREPDGSIRYRVALARVIVDSVTLECWGVLPLDLAAGASASVDLPVIRVLDGTSGTVSMEVAAASDIRLVPGGAGWTRRLNGIAGSEESRPATSSSHLASNTLWTWSSRRANDRPPALDAIAPLPVALPEVLVSRMLLRSTLEPDGAIQTEAWYRIDSNRGSLQLALPQGARILRVQIADEPADLLPESGTAGSSYRLALPASTTDPVLVGISYQVPSSRKSRPPLESPRLLTDASVLESLWEVRMGWTHAMVGTPAGWGDENRWYWAQYVWKRRPVLDTADLARWIATGSAGGRPGFDTDLAVRLGHHAYLFSRAGAPTSFHPRVMSRPLLVAVCSGTILALGMLLIWFPQTGRQVALGVVATAAAAGIALAPDESLLAIQAGAAGLLLAILAAVTQYVVNRRKRRAAGAAAGVVGPTREARSPAADHDLGPASEGSSISEIGADDPTVIRRPVPGAAPPSRPTVSTIDYVPAAPSSSPSSYASPPLVHDDPPSSET